jgi:hypothetical protein
MANVGPPFGTVYMHALPSGGVTPRGKTLSRLSNRCNTLLGKIFIFSVMTAFDGNFAAFYDKSNNALSKRDKYLYQIGQLT